MTKEQSGKNAYEIRLEVLQMAMNLADNRWHQQLDKARFEAERTETGTYELPEDKREREALRLAKKLYSFVENSTEDEG